MRVDVFADVVCPFCYIGLERLSKLAADEGLSVRWAPFQLRPEMAPSGEAWRPFALEKFGGEGGMQAAFAHLENYACDDGVCFRFDRVASAPNTVDAHRVILRAQQRDLGVPVAMSLMKGYFEEGAELRDAQVLAALAGRGGLPADEVRTLLAGDDLKKEVRRSQTLAYQSGVQGVPFYVLGGQYALSGAQPTETMRAALAWAREQGAVSP